MSRLPRFILVAVVFEALALSADTAPVARWLTVAIIVLAIIYMGVIFLGSSRKQMNIVLPQSMSGKVVRKRHWKLF